jgi:hypothetical protein
MLHEGGHALLHISYISIRYARINGVLLGYELLPVTRPLGRNSCVQICSGQICPRAIV